MSVAPAWLAGAASVVEAARWMLAHDDEHVALCEEDGRFLGVLTGDDILYRCVASGDDPATTAAQSLMSAGCPWVDPSTTLYEAMQVAIGQSWRTVPVVDRGQLVGTVGLDQITDQLMIANEDHGPWPMGD